MNSAQTPNATARNQESANPTADARSVTARWETRVRPAPIRQALCVLSLLVSIGAQAQSCSGGVDGGMDATGNQCNTLGAAGLLDSGNATAAVVNRTAATSANDSGTLAQAAARFGIALKEGDVRGAQLVAVIYRFGAR